LSRTCSRPIRERGERLRAPAEPGEGEPGRFAEHWEDGQPDHAARVAGFLPRGARILDLGCGSGRDSLYLAEQGFDVWGVDISEPAVRRALSKPRSSAAHFLVADAERLPFASGSFDGVYSRYALNRPRLDPVSAEVLRVLKAGGTAFLHFLLDMTMVLSGQARTFLRKGDILSALGGFRILESREFEIFDLVGERSHHHDGFSVLMDKPGRSSPGRP
jgi:ubiquinone/menaquinone biosynthesis C-methylase UbiE